MGFWLGPVMDGLNLPLICPYPFLGDNVAQIDNLCVEKNCIYWALTSALPSLSLGIWPSTAAGAPRGSQQKTQYHQCKLYTV